MTRKPRIAVYGGDDRNEQLEWPGHLDVQFYPYKSPRSVDRLKDAISSGSIDHLVVLTSYVGHGYTDALKAYGRDTNVIRWPKSPGQLSREIGKLVPPPMSTNPLLRPSSPTDPGTGGGRGPLTPKVEAELTVPRFEHVLVGSTSPPDETLARALVRIIQAEGMTQTELAKMLGMPQSTLNNWIKGKSRPKDMGPLVDLWPELSRFDLEHEHVVAPTAAEAEIRAAEDLKELIRGVKTEVPKERTVAVAPPMATPPGPTGARPNRTAEIDATLARWRRAKEEVETTERYLLLLLREAGL